MPERPDSPTRTAKASRIARNGVGAVLGLGVLYLSAVGFASIPRQIFFPATERPSDCTSTIDDVSRRITQVATGGDEFSFDHKLRTQARLEGLRIHCSQHSQAVKRLMQAHEHAWILEERRQAFFRRFKLASLSQGSKNTP